MKTDNHQSNANKIDKRSGISVTGSKGNANGAGAGFLSGDFNLRILQSPSRYIREIHGLDKLREISSIASIDLEELDGRSNWTSAEQVNVFLTELRNLVENDDAFKDACTYRMKESYGPFRFFIRAFSPKLVYESAMKSMHLISRISRYEIISSGRNWIEAKYISKKAESRLMCLSRQAQATAMPRMWGLPEAIWKETKCMANGDDACEFRIQWYASMRWLPTIVGLMLGIMSVFMLSMLDIEHIPLWFSFPLLGAAFGHIFELRKTNRINIELGKEVNDALGQLAEEDAEARREIMDLNKRQKEWSRMMEEQVAERTAMLNQVIERIKEMQVERVSSLRGFTHDLRNPLGVMKGGASFLRYNKDRSDSEVDLLNGIENAAGRVSDMLEDLLVATESETGFVKITPQNMETESLAEQLRRRVRALAHGREIRVSVFSTREAPEIIETDIQVLNRVIDNLLTNAVKYTERGSIVVELDGLPGFLTIKVSDTGRGIEEGKIKQIFQPRGSDESQRAPGSWGLGLSVVVQLLDQIGGKLEVMSKLNKGTTFWAHFPVEISTDSKKKKKEEKTDAFARVVKIRPVSQS